MNEQVEAYIHDFMESRMHSMSDFIQSTRDVSLGTAHVNFY